jgi:hypothetical protein
MQIYLALLSVLVSLSIASPTLQHRQATDCFINEDCGEGYYCETGSPSEKGGKLILKEFLLLPQ